MFQMLLRRGVSQPAFTEQLHAERPEDNNYLIKFILLMTCYEHLRKKYPVCRDISIRTPTCVKTQTHI